MSKLLVESNIRAVMAARKIRTLKEVIEITGLSKPTIQRIDSGDIRSTSFDSLLTVCEKLGCDFQELVKIKKLDE